MRYEYSKNVEHYKKENILIQEDTKTYTTYKSSEDIDYEELNNISVVLTWKKHIRKQDVNSVFILVKNKLIDLYGEEVEMLFSIDNFFVNQVKQDIKRSLKTFKNGIQNIGINHCKSVVFNVENMFYRILEERGVSFEYNN